MTTTQPTQVTVESDSYFEGLLALYDELKANADEAKKNFDALKEAIKLEANRRAPESTKTMITSGFLERPLVVSYREVHGIDTRALHEKEPEIAAQFTKIRGEWRVERQR